MDDNEVLFVAGMAATAVTVISSSRIVAARKWKPRTTWWDLFLTAFRIRRLQSAEGRTPRKRHKYIDTNGFTRLTVEDFDELPSIIKSI